MGDAWEDTWDDISGFFGGLFKGLAGLVGGILVLAKDGIVIAASSQIPDPIEPDFLKKEANTTINKYANAAASALDDPLGVLESIGQSFSDTYEKEGIAYLAGAAAPSFIPVAGVVGKLGKVAKVAGKVPASKTKGFSGNIKANIDNLIGGNKAFSGFKNRVSGQISSAASQFTKALKAPFSNKFVQGALSRARSELAQVGRALGGLKIPVGIEKQVVSTGFNNINTYGLKTKTINDQFSQFAKVGDRVEGSGQNKSKVTKGTDKLNSTKDIYKVSPKDIYQALEGYEQTHKFKAHFRGFEVKAQRSLSHMSDKQLIYSFKKGYSPKDGANDTIVLHHHEQKVEGPIIEMPSRYHDLGNKKQHPFGNSGGVGSGEARIEFNKWRKEYWKARYANEMIKRGIIE
ncbi:HNH/ENDO VII family nuclease [Bacillus massilinigeriensis]|uniref:HNH/ENDO VII family nuclease n=1 Tax=Bacillus mediterraneensis TaxID=1805474 RepID=UPI0008F8A77B